MHVSRTELIATLGTLVGHEQVLTSPDDMAPHLVDWRRRYHGAACCVVRPGCTEHVAAVVRACVDAGVPIVPQGGNTGHVGGGIPGGKPFKAAQLGGPSGGCVPKEYLDTPLDYNPCRSWARSWDPAAWWS